MTQILGPNGQPAREYLDSRSGFVNKKATPPKTGEAFGNWAGKDLQMASLPGGGIVQFDLSKLTLADFRNMRDHYQVNASLAVLSFMQHQSDWHIECEDQKIADHVEENLRKIWTQLNRSLSVASWAGYSPNVLQWENDINGRTVQLDKIKDLYPDECGVNWKLVEGWAPEGRTRPKHKIYDGINVLGQGWPIPTDNSFWYPLLMEHGDHGGKKLLRPAFQSWFFSILMHLFANRYYERYGEPTPIARAPFEDAVEIEGESISSRQFMGNAIQSLRNRSVVILPSDRSQVGESMRSEYDYDLQYLESQMRGADFERYLTRLDEEISIGMFTPILLLRTADVGSYNLGQGHERIYQLMINAMNADRKQYIDKYILRRMVDFNFSEKAPAATITFRKMGNTDAAMLKEIVVALINGNKAKIDLDELGMMAGMTLTEIRETVADPAPAPPEPAVDPATGEPAPDASTSRPTPRDSRAVAKEVSTRVRGQIEAAYRRGTFDDLQVNMGFKKKMESAFSSDGLSEPISKAGDLYGSMDHWFSDITSSLKPADFSGPDAFMDLFNNVLEARVVEAYE